MWLLHRFHEFQIIFLNFTIFAPCPPQSQILGNVERETHFSWNDRDTKVVSLNLKGTTSSCNTFVVLNKNSVILRAFSNIIVFTFQTDRPSTITLYIYIYIYIYTYTNRRPCPWHNGYCSRKWICQTKFKT